MLDACATEQPLKEIFSCQSGIPSLLRSVTAGKREPGEGENAGRMEPPETLETLFSFDSRPTSFKRHKAPT